MNKDEIFGLIILFSIITISLFGGAKGVSRTGFLSSTNKTTTQKPLTQAEIQRQLNKAKYDAEQLQKKIQAEEDKKYQSVYYGMVTLYSVNKSTDPKNEYITIKVNTTKDPINVTGWTIKSKSSGISVKIPQATRLFFANTNNSEEDVYLKSGEKIYLITGISPNGSSFKVNKCSGYLTQFQTFKPSLSTSCPQPRNEDLSSIPKSPNNDACLDYIDRFPRCRIQTTSLPANWSYECTNFIYSKINYPSCINIHKEDKDFYLSEWRIYLKRSERLWKDKREDLVLLDNQGKIVDTLQY